MATSRRRAWFSGAGFSSRGSRRGSACRDFDRVSEHDPRHRRGVRFEKRGLTFAIPLAGLAEHPADGLVHGCPPGRRRAARRSGRRRRAHLSADEGECRPGRGSALHWLVRTPASSLQDVARLVDEVLADHPEISRSDRPGPTCRSDRGVGRTGRRARGGAPSGVFLLRAWKSMTLTAPTRTACVGLSSRRSISAGGMSIHSRARLKIWPIPTPS